MGKWAKGSKSGNDNKAMLAAKTTAEMNGKGESASSF
jgi:hypothetical protein